MTSPDQAGHTPPNSLDEIRTILADMPRGDLEAGSAVLTREAQLTKPAGALGRLEELSHWIATWQAKPRPQVTHPRVAVFASNHGVAVRGVSAYPSAVTAEMVRNFIAGGAAVNQMCRIADADLRVYEMNLEEPTRDFTIAPAMDGEECAQAMSYGMMAVEPGVDLLALGEMGIANTTSAAALALALFGGSVKDWVGPGTGVNAQQMEAKRDTVAAGIARHRDTKDPLALLAALGGRELAAIAGAVIAARFARVPVLLDGFACTVAASVLYTLDRTALDHCQVAHLSPEPGHRLVCEQIGKKPLLDLGMRLGEGSGAALAINLVKSALACHDGMRTFAEAGISGPA